MIFRIMDALFVRMDTTLILKGFVKNALTMKIMAVLIVPKISAWLVRVVGL